MKLIITLLVVSILSSYANDSYSQNQKISINLKNSTVKDVFGEIENKSEFIFFYYDDILDVNRRVTVKVKDGTIYKLLDELFKSTDNEYQIIDRQIVITKNPQAALSPPIAENSIDNYVNVVQQNTISGTVTDEKGQPLPGVSIVVKGTTLGTITDIAGNFELSIPPDAQILVFSFMGMQTQELEIGSTVVFNIVLKEDVIGIDEVVVVGYGTQRRINLTGSVATITGKELQSKAISRTASALAGELSGVSIRQGQGNPGRDTPDIVIRGLGTFSSAGNSPLIIVDGLPGSLEAVNPNDIQSISVLKDAASASIYGARAANGVIIIETKTGSAGVTKISYNSYIGRQVVTEMPDFLNSWEYAEAYNEALFNTGKPPLYTDEDIQKFKSGEDPDNYPNYPHYKKMYSSGRGLQTRHDLTLTAGTKETQVYFSLGFIRNEGIVMKNISDRYQMQLNTNTRLKDNILLSVRLQGNIGGWEEPLGRYNDLLTLSQSALRMPNVIPGKRSDGSYGHIETAHPLADLESGGFYRSQNKDISSNIKLSWDIFKDLKISGILGYQFNNLYSKEFLAEYEITPIFIFTPNRLTVTNSNSNSLVLQTLLNYDKTFGNHTINILGGLSSEDNFSNSLSGFRDKFPTNLLHELNVASVDNRTNSGSSSQHRLVSYFGRGNYSYLNKYLLEANFRYDGTSRLPSGRRFDIFPSFSAGWRISEEEFFQNVSLTNEVKIRGSWGELGNQSIGNYPYQAAIALGQNTPIGGTLASGAAINTLPNANIIWETTRISDLGIDISMFQNRLSLTADYYIKTTFDILYPVSASDMLGATPSIENAASVKNKGLDFDLTYRNNFKDLSYGISANFTTINNQVLEIANLERDISRSLFVGYPIGSYYGYVSDGLFIDENDIANYPTQPYTAQPGTIRLKDLSGPDGVPDGKVTTDDRQVLGTENSKYMYGFRMDAEYKNWDAYIVFQGEAGGLRGMNTWMHAFHNAGNIQRWQYEQRWSQDNPDPNAGHPILLTTDRPEPGSDFFYFPAGYLRLKNLQIGYNLPSTLIQKLKISKARIFISGTNLFIFDRNQEGWDPEMLLNGQLHNPLTSVYTFGINIDF